MQGKSGRRKGPRAHDRPEKGGPPGGHTGVKNGGAGVGVWGRSGAAESMLC